MFRCSQDKQSDYDGDTYFSSLLFFFVLNNPGYTKMCIELKATPSITLRTSEIDTASGTPSTVFAERVFDVFFFGGGGGTGLNRTVTDHTEYKKRPSKNIIGQLLAKIAGKNRPPRKSISVPRNFQMSDQENIFDMLSSIWKSD